MGGVACNQQFLLFGADGSTCQLWVAFEPLCIGVSRLLLLNKRQLRLRTDKLAVAHTIGHAANDANPALPAKSPATNNTRKLRKNDILSIRRS